MQSNFKGNYPRRSQNIDYQPLILIVDNDRDNLLFASYVIESMGMQYSVLDDSQKCLATMRQLVPDMILLDVVMPKLDGLEIARAIKQDLTLAHIPIIAVTGLTETKDKQDLVTAGFDDYICKPYLIEDLERKVYSCLRCLLIDPK